MKSWCGLTLCAAGLCIFTFSHISFFALSQYVSIYSALLEYSRVLGYSGNGGRVYMDVSVAKSDVINVVIA